MKDILKTALVLSIIAIISGALLGYINEVTYISAEEILAGKLQAVYAEADSYDEIENASDIYVEDFETADLVGVHIPVKDGIKVAETYIYNVSGKGYGGEIELLVLVENNKITGIVKVSASETPGLGNNAFSEDFFSRFYNLDLASNDTFALTKYQANSDEEVVSVTSATITSTAMVKIMNLVQVVHKQVLEGGILE
jgi:RnfABCDGE-type electron transport complex G subunit